MNKESYKKELLKKIDKKVKWSKELEKARGNNNIGNVILCKNILQDLDADIVNCINLLAENKKDL